MNHESPERLPSLAHSIIINPAEEGEVDKEPLQLPPFPQIDLNWDGFTISHLHWVGIKATKYQEWQVLLAIWHELQHKDLALTHFSMLRKYEMFRLYDTILTTLEEGAGKGIQVPLTPNKTGNNLQKQLALIARLHRASSLVEEVFAVRTSLLNTREARKISHLMRRGLILKYKTKYGKYIDGFGKAYEIFDFVASKIGETAATSMIYNVLSTLNPTEAFSDILFDMFTIDLRGSTTDFVWHVSDEDTNYISNLSATQAYDLFSHVIDDLDPDDSRYGRKDMLDIAAAIRREWSVEAQDSKSDFITFLLGSPDAFLFSEYSDFIHPFFEATRHGNSVIQEVKYGNFVLVLEAIWQQLTQAIGLLCPFWMYSPHGCCGGCNRALLEKVWECTSDSSCERWKRLGCLDKKAVARFQREHYKTSAAKQ